MTTPHILMTDPAHYEVAYSINPWMRPERWAADLQGNRAAARRAWLALRDALEGAGAQVVEAAAVEGLPDMVFPANCAVILDGNALIGRFRHPERHPESLHFLSAFEELAGRGLLREVHRLPEGLEQEGAGDCIWDPCRQLFWAGHGPRSSRAAADYVSNHFQVPVVPLELVAPHYYHLDVCLMPLEGGEIVHYPAAFSSDALTVLRSRVPADLLIEVDEEEAATLAINAVNIGRAVIMAEGAPRLAAQLRDRGYAPVEVDLDPFIQSGGASFCMTLRLDLERGEADLRAAD
jgi:N-dimethylarginine dimethylaminohydrolase